jgi:hypothetical protein
MQLRVKAWAPINPSIGLECDVDLLCKDSIFSAMLTRFAFAPGIISADRYLKHIAHHCHRIFLLMIRHELIPYSWLREKMLTASDRISLFTKTYALATPCW